AFGVNRRAIWKARSKFHARARSIFSESEFGRPHKDRRAFRTRLAVLARVIETADRPVCREEFSGALSLRVSALRFGLQAQPARARFSLHEQGRCPRQKNRDASPDARAKINHRFFRRARRLRPGRQVGSVGPRERLSEFLPDTFPLCLNRRGEATHCASTRAEPPRA